MSENTLNTHEIDQLLESLVVEFLLGAERDDVVGAGDGRVGEVAPAGAAGVADFLAVALLAEVGGSHHSM